MNIWKHFVQNITKFFSINMKLSTFENFIEIWLISQVMILHLMWKSSCKWVKWNKFQGQNLAKFYIKCKAVKMGKSNYVSNCLPQSGLGIWKEPPFFVCHQYKLRPDYVRMGAEHQCVPHQLSAEINKYFTNINLTKLVLAKDVLYW